MGNVLRLDQGEPEGGHPPWQHLVPEVSGELRFPRVRLREPDLLEDREHGALAWLMHGPARRSWDTSGGLDSAADVPSEVIQDGQDVVIRATGRAEVDLLVLTGAAREAFLHDAPEPLGVSPVAAPLGGPRDLRRFLVGGAVLAPPFPWGSRMASEQMALSIYRIARLRSGPFWTAVAAHVAEWTRERIELPGGTPSRQEHLRLVADGALLLLAEAERTARPEYARAAGVAVDVLDACAVPYREGIWYRHDELEAQAGDNHLVLNTHVQAMTVLLAAGRDPAPAQRALDAVLTLRPPRGSVTWSAGLAVGDLARSARGPLRRAGVQLATASLRGAGRSQSKQEFLRLPGGRLLRHTLAEAEPFHYFIVNLSDLAAVYRTLPTPSTRGALDAGLRLARATRYFAAQKRMRDPTSLLVPTLMRNAGLERAAAAEAGRLSATGLPAAVGWPGREDALWARLAPGTP